MLFDSQVDYKAKKEEVLSRFKKDFMENYYKYDPAFRSIAELLIRGADPYQIIEELIVDRRRIIDEFTNKILNA